MDKEKKPKKGPMVMGMESGTYIWCGCGLTEDEPFCDNAHRGTEFEKRGKAAMAVNIDEEGEKAWCLCKKTKNPPWCDGSHNREE